MGWIESESFWFICPGFNDGLVWCEALECLQPSAKVIRIDEVVEVVFELLMAIIVVSLDGGFLDGAVHSLDLAVGPWMPDFG